LTAFVEQQVRCEAERSVEFVCGKVDVSDRGDGGDGYVSERGDPVVVFGIVYDPSFLKGRVGVGTGKGKRVEESGVVRSKA
jgi:hypothetical protein